MSWNRVHKKSLTSVILITALTWLGGAQAAQAQGEGELTSKKQDGVAGMSPSSKTDLTPQPEIVVIRKGTTSAGPMMAPALAPWVEFNVTATSHEFQVRQPGRYAAKWGRLQVRSNAAVVIDFEGFGDLVTRSIPRPVPWEVGTAPPLSPVETVDFMPAEAFNAQDIRLTREEAHDFQCDLWSRITVTTGAAAGDYVRKAAIVLVLETARDWEEANDLSGTERD